MYMDKDLKLEFLERVKSEPMVEEVRDEDDVSLCYPVISQHCQPVPPPVDKLPIEKTGEAPV